jgi:hypothetical protein
MFEPIITISLLGLFLNAAFNALKRAAAGWILRAEVD